MSMTTSTGMLLAPVNFQRDKSQMAWNPPVLSGGFQFFLLGIRWIKPLFPLAVVQVDAVDGSTYGEIPSVIQVGHLEGILIN
jgi:hypothetical protein